jgi:hypothetical protein
MKWRVRRVDLPLMVYREVAAHLNQVPGVSTDLEPQRSPVFDYTLSQIDSLWIECSSTSPAAKQQVDRILAYYSDRYGNWEIVE